MRHLITRLMLWAFDRLYHEGAWAYDAVAWAVSRGYWRAWATVLVPELKSVPVLELGCGTGYVQLARATDAAPTVGVDESVAMLQVAQRRLRSTPASSCLVRAVGQHLPFAASSWPVVLATFPAPYIFESATLAEIRRVLQPAGRLLIIDGGILSPSLYARLVALVYRILLGRSALEAQDAIHAAPVADPRIERLAAFGFSTRVSWRTVGASKVQVLEAWIDERCA